MKPFSYQQLPAQRVGEAFYFTLHTIAVSPAPTFTGMPGYSLRITVVCPLLFPRALKVSADELLGTTAITQKSGRKPDTRLERRLQQIEKLDAADKRQVIQLIDAFIERGQLKRQAHATTRR